MRIYDTEALLDRVLDIALKETDLAQKRARYRCEHPSRDEMNYLENIRLVCRAHNQLYAQSLGLGALLH